MLGDLNAAVIAHVKENSLEVQPLISHLKETALLAKDFAKAFHAENVAECVALLHDVGKFKADFQEYIRHSSNLDGEESNGSVGKVDHSAVGAIWADENIKNPLKCLIPYIIAGRHTGLPDCESVNGQTNGSPLSSRLQNKDNLTESLKNGGKEFLSKIEIPELPFKTVKKNGEFTFMGKDALFVFSGC